MTLMRLRSVKRSSKDRHFRPCLGSPDIKLESRSAPSSFFYWDPNFAMGVNQAQSTSQVVSDWQQVAYDDTVVGPNGGVTDSAAEGVVFWTADYSEREPVLTAGLTLREVGQVGSGVTMGGVGTSVGSIIAYGTHQHTELITADNAQNYYIGHFPNGGSQTTQTSSTPNHFDVKGPSGTFVPGTTLTVDISIVAQNSLPRFYQQFYLNVSSTHFNLAAAFGERDNGVTITDPSTNAVIDSDPNFSSGESLTYEAHLVFAAQSKEYFEFYSQYQTAPSDATYWRNEVTGQTTEFAWTVQFTLS